MTKPMKTSELASGQHGKPPVVEVPEVDNPEGKVPPPIKMAIKLKMPPDGASNKRKSPYSNSAAPEPPVPAQPPAPAKTSGS